MARLPVPPECLLGSDPRAGLDSAQVAERRRQFGDNDVTEDRHRPCGRWSPPRPPTRCCGSCC
ncbi:cation-transporting P-type ATPase [Pseudoxanthomonas suwonensis]